MFRNINYTQLWKVPCGLLPVFVADEKDDQVTWASAMRSLQILFILNGFGKK